MRGWAVFAACAIASCGGGTASDGRSPPPPATSSTPPIAPPNDAKLLMRPLADVFAPVGGTAQLAVGFENRYLVKGPITVDVTGLPEGMTATKRLVPEGELGTTVPLVVAATAKQAASRATVTATGPAGERLSLELTATIRGTSGALDETFGTSGVVGLTAMPQPVRLVRAVTTGLYVLAADCSVRRYDDATGALDPSFAAGGTFVLARPGAACSDIEARPDGTIVLAGRDDAGTLVARLAGGALDPGFGAGGVVALGAHGDARSVVVDADGRIVVAMGTSGLELARLTPAGASDPTFVPPNVVTYTHPALLTADDDGGFFFVATSSTMQPAFASFLGDGTVSVSTLPLPAGSFAAAITHDMTLRPASGTRGSTASFHVAGVATSDTGTKVGFAMRLPAGQFDPTFGNHGGYHLVAAPADVTIDAVASDDSDHTVLAGDGPASASPGRALVVGRVPLAGEAPFGAASPALAEGVVRIDAVTDPVSVTAFGLLLPEQRLLVGVRTGAATKLVRLWN